MKTTAEYQSTRRLLLSSLSDNAIESAIHGIAWPPHGDECDRCRIRNKNYRASEARRARYLARLKRICLTHPSERALTAYTSALAYDWR